MEIVLDKGCNIGAIFMDLSKKFDTLNHKLLLACGFSENPITFIKSCLSNKHQRVNINNKFSTWKNTYKGVPQVFVLDPLSFIIFVNDIFYFIENYYLCKYISIHCI